MVEQIEQSLSQRISEQIIPIAHAEMLPEPPKAPQKTLQELAKEVAEEYEIPTQTLFNLVESESQWDSNATGDMDIICKSGVNKGKPVRARGLGQITDCSHPEVSDEEAFDPEFSLKWIAQTLKDNDEWKEYTVCNCFSYASVKIGSLPKMADIKHNIEYPVVGGLVIFRYTGGVKHIAVVTNVSPKGISVTEANFQACKTGERLISWNDPHIAGYWTR